MTSSTRTSTCSKTADRVSIADIPERRLFRNDRYCWLANYYWFHRSNGPSNPASSLHPPLHRSQFPMPDLTKDERRALKQHMKGDKWSYSMGVSGRLCPSCAQGSPHAFPPLPPVPTRLTLRCTPLAGHERRLHGLRHRPLSRALLDCPSREEHVHAHQPILSLQAAR